jgi:hypothetical protein
MKGQVSAIIIGVCIILAAAILVGQITFPEAMAVLWSVVFWVIVAIVVIILIIFAIIIIAALLSAL